MGELQKMPEFGIGKDFETSITKLENQLKDKLQANKVNLRNYWVLKLMNL